MLLHCEVVVLAIRLLLICEELFAVLSRDYHDIKAKLCEFLSECECLDGSD